MQATAYVCFKPDTEERSTYLYRAYTKWCEDNLESPVPQKKFSQFLLKNAGKYGLTFSKHIEGKFAFVKRSETMKSPVGTLSDRTVLRSKMEGLCPDKLNFCAAKYTLCKRCKEFMAFLFFWQSLHTFAHLLHTLQKSHEIFRFTASTVDIPTRWNPRAKQQQRVALADFSAAPWQGFEKSERGPNNSSLFQPQAAVVVVSLG